MATTQKAPPITRRRVTREMLEDRWSLLMFSVQTKDLDATSSELLSLWTEAIRQTAGRLIGGCRGQRLMKDDGTFVEPGERYEGHTFLVPGEEYDDFGTFEDGLHDLIHDRMIAFAEGIEAKRAAR